MKAKRLVQIRPKKPQPDNMLEMKLLTQVADDLRSSGSRVLVNPVHDIPSNLDWLKKFRKDAERQIVLIDEAIGKLLGSEVYKEEYTDDATDRLFAATT